MSRGITDYLQCGSWGEHIGNGATLWVAGEIVAFLVGAAAAVKVPASIMPEITTKRVFFMVVPLVIDMQICLCRFGGSIAPKSYQSNWKKLNIFNAAGRTG